MRFLAFQLKRIGDLVLTTPALHALKHADPNAHVTVALTATTAPLLPAMAEFIDEALISHASRDHRHSGGAGNWPLHATDAPSASGFGRVGSDRPLWRQLLRGGFDASLDFTGRDRSALLTLAAHAPRRLAARSALRGPFGGGWRRFCYNVTAETSVRSRHTVDHYLDCVAALGVPVPPASAGAPATPILRVPPAAAKQAGTLLAVQKLASGEDFVVIHPGTARAEKYWLPERWARVINFCQDELGRRCVLTGGRGDRREDAHLEAIRAHLRQPCADLSGELDLLTLTAVLAAAGLVLGVDSGPMHLAAAAGRQPQLVLFGPTNPFHWRPRHPGGLVLQAGHGDAPLCAPGDFAPHSARGDMDAISTDAVIACIRSMPLPGRAPASGTAPGGA